MIDNNVSLSCSTMLGITHELRLASSREITTSLNCAQIALQAVISLVQGSINYFPYRTQVAMATYFDLH